MLEGTSAEATTSCCALRSIRAKGSITRPSKSGQSNGLVPTCGSRKKLDGTRRTMLASWIAQCDEVDLEACLGEAFEDFFVALFELAFEATIDGEIELAVYPEVILLGDTVRSVVGILIIRAVAEGVCA